MDAFSFQTITPTTCIRELKAWVSSKLHPIIIGVQGVKYLCFYTQLFEIENRRQHLYNIRAGYYFSETSEGGVCQQILYIFKHLLKKIYVLMPLFHNKWVLSFKEIHILAPKVLSLISGESANISRPCCNWWRRKSVLLLGGGAANV